jgi:undecaprenyl-diphosphatase
MRRDGPMNNLHLFDLINAGPDPGRVPLAVAHVLATQVNSIVLLGLAFIWVRGTRKVRGELLEMLLGCAVALGLAQLVLHFWPQPRPFMLHVGTQYLGHAAGPGLPSHHVTFLWALGFSALGTRRLAVLGLPLLAVGLAVGWSRVFLGVHFPYDVLAAAPVALAGAVAARLLQRLAVPVYAWVVFHYDRLDRRFAAWLIAAHPS